MKTRQYIKLFVSFGVSLILLLSLDLSALAAGGDSTHNSAGSSETQRNKIPGDFSISTALSLSPLMFIENIGQFDNKVSYQVHSGNSTFWLSEDAIWVTTLAQASTVTDEKILIPFSQNGISERDLGHEGVNLRLSFVGSNLHPSIEPLNRMGTSINYYVGNDSSRWKTNIPAWAGVRYVDLYPGIDLEISIENNCLVPHIIARPGADLNKVQLRVDGANVISMAGGYLLLKTRAGDYSLPLFQVTGKGFGKIPSPIITGKQVVSPFNRSVDVAAEMDPLPAGSTLLFSTYLGGSQGDLATGIAVDTSGATYITGYTYSSDFPTTPGSFSPSFNGGSEDVFVVKLNPIGTAIEYATFIGGSSYEYGTSITVDSNGAAYITGSTNSSDFPTTPGAFQTTNAGGDDSFVTKLSGTGSELLFSTYLGGNSSEYNSWIAIDSSNNPYIMGRTRSTNFPTTPGAFDTINNGDTDEYIVKLNSEGSALIFSTYIGGNGNDEGGGIAVDNSGAVFITGNTNSNDFPTTPGAYDTTISDHNLPNAYAAKLNPTGTALVYSTFLGDIGNANGIAIDNEGAAYVTGYVGSWGIPTTPGSYDTTYNGNLDSYVIKLNPVGSAIEYGTYLGGSGQDFGDSIAVDMNGAAYVLCRTTSSDFPITQGAFDITYNGFDDLVILKINSAGSALIYSTYYGGAADDRGGSITIDSNGGIYITGTTYSSDFPTTIGAFDTSFNSSNGSPDTFVVKLAFYLISGSAGVAGATLSYTDGSAKTATADSSGNYSFPVSYNWSGTVTPSKQNYSFSPVNRSYTNVLADQTSQDYIAITFKVYLPLVIR